MDLEGDPDLTLSLNLFMATAGSSRQTYTDVCSSIKDRYPDSKILSYDQITRRIAECSGIYPVYHDMCINSCVGFTGPLEKEDKCPTCKEPRYDRVIFDASHGKVLKARQRFVTLLLGPQIQAQWASCERARDMHYAFAQLAAICAELRLNGSKIHIYEDLFTRMDILRYFKACDPESGEPLLGKYDVMALFSCDGAQLYQNKASDTWIAQFLILNLLPWLRYMQECTLPACVIPGPKKPGNMDSFLFPTLHHAACLMKEGITISDALLGPDHRATSKLHLFIAAADGPGLATVDGSVGHNGACGCRLPTSRTSQAVGNTILPGSYPTQYPQYSWELARQCPCIRRRKIQGRR
jgi:hypothetical protein